MLNYDRRGRGDSDDTLPFAVEREVEDLDVMLAAAGGSATVVGLSSGAALAAEAAVQRVADRHARPVGAAVQRRRGGPRQAKEYTRRAGRRCSPPTAAATPWRTSCGASASPSEMIAGMRQSPYWELGERLAPTLAYDAAVLGDTTIPVERYGRIDVPTLVLAGLGEPRRSCATAAAEVAAAIPGARHDVLEGQDHNVAGDVLAPAVAQFGRSRSA